MLKAPWSPTVAQVEGWVDPELDLFCYVLFHLQFQNIIRVYLDDFKNSDYKTTWNDNELGITVLIGSTVMLLRKAVFFLCLMSLTLIF